MAARAASTDFLNQLNTLSLTGAAGNLSDQQLLLRYLSAPDNTSEAAFMALVERHGPMVLRVCRQYLGNSHDAQDAYQATFLALAHKAGSIRKPDSLGSWLHGVALRVSARVKANESRRKRSEQERATLEAADSPSSEGLKSWWEIHEELARLPKHYREPVVLCYLEGLTAEAAALRLGCPRGTVLSRLSRAKDQLRTRLTRRGLAPAQAMAWLTSQPLVTVSESQASASKVLSLLAALRLTIDGPTHPGTISVSTLALTQGVLRTMALAKLQSAAVVLISGTLLAITTAGVYAYQHGDNATKPTPALAQNTAPAPDPRPDTTQKANAPSPQPAAPDRASSEPSPSVKYPALHELATQLELARKRAQRYEPLRAKGFLSKDEVTEADSEKQLLVARIADLAQQMEDDLELLKVQREAKQAEVKGTQAQVDIANIEVRNTERLVKDHVTSSNELAILQAKLLRQNATMAVRVAEEREVDIRIRQLEKRLHALAPLLKASGPAAEPSPKPNAANESK